MTPRSSVFASESIAEHVLRGIGAAALAGGAFWLLAAPGGWRVAAAVAALPGAVVLLRGCPMCWLTGLFETISNRIAKEPVDDQNR